MNICRMCGKEYESDLKFCSPACREKLNNKQWVSSDNFDYGLLMIGETGVGVKIDYQKASTINFVKWNIDARGRIAARINGRKVFLNRYLTDCPAGMYVRHLNGDKLDCRLINLLISDTKRACLK